MKNYKSMLCVFIIATFFSCLTLAAWLLHPKEFSDSERRKLAQPPELSAASISDGSFMTDFESYTQDQFPMRNIFRTIKAFFNYNVLNMLDNNDIYISGGYAAKLEYPLDESSLEYATDRFEYIYDTYLKDKSSNIYLSVIPDKSYFLAEPNGYLSMDYEKLCSIMQEKMSYAEYIDIFDTLDISDYYKTDTHWRQEKLLDTAAELAAGMGASLSDEYTENTLEQPFYGVYYGQAALPMPGESLSYLTSDTLDGCIVTNHENGTVGGIYNMAKAAGKDPYELFLSGSVSLITIENPNAAAERELIIFRDSFGSSIVPLLAECYSKITLVDIRYLRTDHLDRFIDFENKDVLFLYSTLILNSSSTLT